MKSRDRFPKMVLFAVRVLLLAFVGGVILLPFLESRAASAGSVLERVRKSGELRFNVVVGEEPSFIKDPTTGEWTGHNGDIASAIAAILKVKAVPVETTWGGLAMDLQAGKIDMAVGVNPTPERALVVDFTTHPTHLTWYVVVGRKGVKTDTWADLSKPTVRIGVEAGSSYDTITTRFAPQANIIRFRTRDECILALDGGRIDVFVQSITNALLILKKRPGIGEVGLPKPLVSAPTGIMVAREAGDKAWWMFLNTTVWYLHSSGFTHAAILKHLGRYGITADDLPSGMSF